MLFELSKSKSECKRAKRVTLQSIGWKEKDLENLIANHITELIHTDDLLVFFTERSYQEEPDILALDMNGDMYIFELKRWSSSKENLLQVLRYGQKFGVLDYEELNNMYHKKSDNSQSLQEIHKKYFNLEDSIEEGSFNQKQHFVIITNGVDQDTVEAISYWRKSGLSMDAIIYWVYDIEGKYYIEFNMYSPVEGYIECETNNYILNTNIKYDKQAAEQMVEKGKAAAFSCGWKEKISRLQKGDLVFLYESGSGIVGYGKADGKLKMRGDNDNEYYMMLDEYIKLSTPISASRMKELCDKGFPFAQTMYHISDECKDKFINEINQKNSARD